MKLRITYIKTPRQIRVSSAGDIFVKPHWYKEEWLSSEVPQAHGNLLVVTHAPKVSARIRGGSTRQRRIALRRLLAWIDSGGRIAPSRSVLIGRAA